MANPTDPEVVGLVFRPDGSYIVCTTPEEVVIRAETIRRDGGAPVVFYRAGQGHRRPDVVNVNHDCNGPIVQTRDIHGGVRF